jgi:site-specific recombinase XerD
MEINVEDNLIIENLNLEIYPLEVLYSSLKMVSEDFYFSLKLNEKNNKMISLFVISKKEDFKKEDYVSFCKEFFDVLNAFLYNGKELNVDEEENV